MHAISFLLKLQIDHVILDQHGQACSGMPKKAFETSQICWSSKGDYSRSPLSCNLFLAYFLAYFILLK